jgi:hypothetical protein
MKNDLSFGEGGLLITAAESAGRKGEGGCCVCGLAEVDFFSDIGGGRTSS